MNQLAARIERRFSRPTYWLRTERFAMDLGDSYGEAIESLLILNEERVQLGLAPYPLDEVTLDRPLTHSRRM